MEKRKMREANGSLAARVGRWLDEQEERNEHADAMINEYIATISVPGVPDEMLRQCEIDARSRGFSYDYAMRLLRVKLKPDNVWA
jgi:hypothetical protein